MSGNLSVDFEQVKSLVSQCDTEEKIELIRLLEKETFPQRFRRLLDRVRTDALTMEEITAEVEAVRQRRHEMVAQKR